MEHTDAFKQIKRHTLDFSISEQATGPKEWGTYLGTGVVSTPQAAPHAASGSGRELAPRLLGLTRPS